MRNVLVAGAGCVKIEEHWDRSLENLMAEASAKALEEAGVEDVDAIYVGNMSGEVLQEQAHLGPIVAEELGMSGVPAVRVESACASGAAAFRAGFLDIASGASDVVLVCGGEKLSEGSGPQVTAAMAMADVQEYAGFAGVTFVGLNALIHRLYLQRYGVKEEDIALFPVLCHKNASTCAHAQYPFEVKLEAVVSSPYIAEPIRRFECAGIGDGAAALVLSAKENQGTPSNGVEIAACTQATDFVSPFDRDDPTWLSALDRACRQAYEVTGVKANEINVLEVHDAFSVLGPLSLEASGMAERGRGTELLKKGELSLSGRLPTNTFGGLKARGHPVGATGVYQIAEVFWQLAGKAGKNQVDGAKIGMAESLGGVAASAVVTLLRASG